MGVEEAVNFGSASGCPTRPWTKAESKARERFIPVVFDKPFSSTPSVFLGITGEDVKLDPKLRTSIRLKTEARDITPEGFTMYIGTWCYTKVNWAQVQWIAAVEDSAT